jgi:hypothetical protein
MSIVGQCSLFSGQVREKPETSNTIGADFLAFGFRVTAQEVPGSVPDATSNPYLSKEKQR